MKAVEPACRRLIAKSKATPRRNPPRTNKAVYTESYITRRVTRSMSRGDDGTGLGESIKEDSRGRRRVLRSRRILYDIDIEPIPVEIDGSKGVVNPSSARLRNIALKSSEKIYDRINVRCDSPNVNHFEMCCLLYTSPSPRDRQKSRMPSSA